MPDDATPLYHNNRVTGYKGSKADTYVPPPKPKEGGVADKEKKATSPMPKQGDFSDTASWMEAVRKWREAQRSAADAAKALEAKKK